MRKILFLLMLSLSLTVFSQDKNIEKNLFKSAVKTKSAKLYLEYFENYYPNGKYIKKAQKKGDDIVFSEAVKNNNYLDLLKYRKYFPNGRNQIKVNYELNRIADHDLKQIIGSESRSDLVRFINNHPDADKQIKAARKRIENLDYTAYKKCKEENTINGYFKFIKQNPDNKYLNDVIDNLWELVKKENNYSVFAKFLSNTPPNKYKAQAEQLIRATKGETSSEDDYQKTYTIVEDMPVFPGGMSALMVYLARNIRYPPLARESGIQGNVFINFVVEPDGSISNVKVLRGIGGGCDEEAVRVVKKMPKWKPGMQRGKAVSVSFNLPVNFRLR